MNNDERKIIARWICKLLGQYNKENLTGYIPFPGVMTLLEKGRVLIIKDKGFLIFNPKYNFVIISKIVVDKAAMGKGTAKELLNQLVELCNLKKYNNIVLRVRTDNDRAIAFYNKNNFKIINTNSKKGNFPEHVMEKII